MMEAFHTPTRGWTTDTWQYALGNLALGHFTTERRRFFTAEFSQVAFTRADQEAEHATEEQLSPLSYDLQLTPELKAHFLERLGALARVEGNIRNSATQIIARARKAGITPDPAELKLLLDSQRARHGACVRDVGG
jgi:hypothetical protein